MKREQYERSFSIDVYAAHVKDSAECALSGFTVMLQSFFYITYKHRGMNGSLNDLRCELFLCASEIRGGIGFYFVHLLDYLILLFF